MLAFWNRKFGIILSLSCLLELSSTTAFCGPEDPIDLKKYSGMTVKQFKEMSIAGLSGKKGSVAFPVVAFSEQTFFWVYRALFNPIGNEAEPLIDRDSLLRDYARISAFLDNPVEVFSCLNYLNEKLKEKIETDLSESDSQALLSLITDFSQEKLNLDFTPQGSVYLLSHQEKYQNVRFQKTLTVLLSQIEAEMGVRLVDPVNQTKRVWFSNNGKLFNETVSEKRMLKDIGAGREHGFYTHQLQWNCVALGKKLDLAFIRRLENDPAVLFQWSVSSDWNLKYVGEKLLGSSIPPTRGSPLNLFQLVSDASIVQVNPQTQRPVRVGYPLWFLTSKGKFRVFDKSSMEDLISESLGVSREQVKLDDTFDVERLFASYSARNPFWLNYYVVANPQIFDALALKLGTYFFKPQFTGARVRQDVIRVYQKKYGINDTTSWVDRKVEGGK